MLRSARWLLLILNAGNWLAIAFFAIMGVGLLAGLPFASDRIVRSALPGQVDTMRRLTLIMFLLGIGTGIAVDIVFRRMLQILRTVAEGLPFVATNGARLRVVAWALLAIQLLDLALAPVFHGISLAARHAPFGWSPSATGWIAVLLLFVLAQVFTQGANMQDELEGTV